MNYESFCIKICGMWFGCICAAGGKCGTMRRVTLLCVVQSWEGSSKRGLRCIT
jgi:hypothetical protein